MDLLVFGTLFMAGLLLLAGVGGLVVRLLFIPGSDDVIPHDPAQEKRERAEEEASERLRYRP